jgi:predicted nucleotidyltransferase
MIQENIQKIKEILTRYTTIDYALIFGSILNKPLHESYVDILLGASLNVSEKLDLAMELELLLKRKVDIVLVKEASCELVLNAFSKGLPVFIKDKVRLKKDYFRNSYLYDDTIPLRQLRTLRIKRKYGYA